MSHKYESFHLAYQGWQSSALIKRLAWMQDVARQDVRIPAKVAGLICSAVLTRLAGRVLDNAWRGFFNQ